MHNGMIQFIGEKMAKSVGNIALLREVLDQYGHEAVVMYLVSGHYRQPLAFSEAALEQAQANVKRIREAGRRLSPGASPADLEPLRDRFFDALARDFNTAEALAVLNEWLGEATSSTRDSVGDAHLREMLGVLGLESLLAADEQAPEEVWALAVAREQARGDRDFAAADRLRDEIAALGWEVRDGPSGFDLIPL
jgi:cysteinyl-tRNA synthetase